VTEGAEEVRIVDSHDGTTIETLPTPGIAGEFPAVAPDGRLIAINSFTNRSVEVWDRATGERLATFANPSPSGEIAFGPDGRLAHTSNDGVIRLVRVDGQADELTLRRHADGVTQIAFTPDGTKLVSTSFVPETRVWDITPAGPSALGNVSVTDGRIWTFTPAADGRTAVTVNLPGDRQRIEVVDPTTGSRTTMVDDLWIAPHNYPTVAEDLTVVAGFYDGSHGHVHDVETGHHRDLAPCWSPRALSRDGSWLVVDGRMLCTVVEGTLQQFEPPPDAVLHSAVVDARTGEVLRDLGQRPVVWAALGPPGTVADGLAALSDWLSIELHDVAADRLVGSLDLDGEFATTVWFSDDGRHLAWSTQAGQVTVIDVATARASDLADAVVWRFRDPHSGVVSHARIADGRLATGNMAGHVRVYDLEDLRLLADLPIEHLGPVHLAFTADGTALLYPDRQAVRRMELDLDRLEALARSLLTRDLTPEECVQHRIERDPCPTSDDA
jgi:WD40 repeat protein